MDPGRRLPLALCCLLLSACATVRGGALEVAAVGDLQLGDLSSAAQLAPLDGDQLLPRAALRFANLEGPLTGTSRATEAGMRFAAPPAAAAWLARRVDVVSLANNHALDQGLAGRADTARALAGQGIAAAWAGHDAELRQSRRRVVVLARDLSEGLPSGAAEDELLAEVRRARRRGAVLVSLHWGRTGLMLPDAGQRRLAGLLVDAGAAAVLGHGPHAPQGVERHGRGVIAYSLGNLAFSCRCTEERDAYALLFRLDPDGGVSRVRLLPFLAGLAGAPPRVVPGDDGLFNLLQELLTSVGQSSQKQGAAIVVPRVD